MYVLSQRNTIVAITPMVERTINTITASFHPECQTTLAIIKRLNAIDTSHASQGTLNRAVARYRVLAFG